VGRQAWGLQETGSIKMRKLTTAQIGRSGELLVQYRLLKHGIESALMTTDSGIDLVAYAPLDKKAVTIQVKSNQQAKAVGGKGQKALNWFHLEISPAEMVALVDLENDSFGMLNCGNTHSSTQQVECNSICTSMPHTNPKGRRRILATSPRSRSISGSKNCSVLLIKALHLFHED
jgi:hypothetical protein